MPLPPEGQVAGFDRETAENVFRAMVFAADLAASRPGPPSTIRNPDGSQQGETAHEFVVRVVRTAFFHALEQNLVVFPADIAKTLDDWIPAERVGTDDRPQS
jgi:hypothetical protein